MTVYRIMSLLNEVVSGVLLCQFMSEDAIHKKKGPKAKEGKGSGRRLKALKIQTASKALKAKKQGRIFSPKYL